MSHALIIGGGPAGLMATQMLAEAGHAVTLAEAKPSLGRKFLMAGKSGLNLTMAEGLDAFIARYNTPALAPMVSAFGPEQVQAWAGSLGQELFTGSTLRVFPKAMKSSPLLRAWLTHLGSMDVTVKTRHRWTGWQGQDACFDTPDGPVTLPADVTVLAMGGASWARLGSDGAWAPLLAQTGAPVTPFEPSNSGLSVDWSPHMAGQFGAPVKAGLLRAGGAESRGEFVITQKGLEGAGLYALTPAIRRGAALTFDAVPHWSRAETAAKLARPRGKESLANHLRKTLGLKPPQRALLQEFARPLPADPNALAKLVKAIPIAHAGLRPIDEAISTTGGAAWEGVDDTLMLKARPGTYLAGEMLDWDAPTGGYLITACLATGRWAGLAAAARLAG
ncbi:TIGR03862 family flavoprotein [Alphaproteobacteria bacterium KMM 3653]|uniref:TIGR03862 family flavoprotein n=1 Tax=Harenicola maris TaxID=2841044 RepID=A0AAP2CP92_9RHOB|nr:TIGR03862 family flavoprotein [Harenicola maris]